MGGGNQSEIRHPETARDILRIAHGIIHELQSENQSDAQGQPNQGRQEKTL